MTASPFDHPFLSPLFGDDEIASEFAADLMLRRFRDFEIAHAHALAGAGLIGPDTARRIASFLVSFHPDMVDIETAVARDGVPVPEYVRQIKAGLAPDLAKAFHRGCTSQDLMDTALVQALDAVSTRLMERLTSLNEALTLAGRVHGDRPMQGRTRMQLAMGITAADRLRLWQAPLPGLMQSLGQLMGEALNLQFGGAVGTRTGLGGKGDEVAQLLADALGLAHPGPSWHANRGGLTRYASWLAEVTGCLGKIGQDVCLMAQNEIAEISLSGAGGSSAMAHKQNPIAAEMLVTMSRFNAVQVSAMHHALVHEQERSGAAWALEWMVLPQMATTTGAALRQAEKLVESIRRMGAGD